MSRGEELYFQETDTHGNLYKNWDSIIDVKAEYVGIPNYDIGSGGGNNGNISANGNGVGIDPLEFVKINSNNNNMPNRRMNNDMRWFSSSSTVNDQNILGVDGGGNNSHRLGRKRSSRLSFSLSPFPSGRSSSRSIISDSDNNSSNNKGIINTNTDATRGSVSPLLVQSSETSTVNQSLANNNETESSKDDNDLEMENMVKNEDEEEPVKQSVKMEEEHDDNDDSKKQNELKKKDPPTAEYEENQEQEEDEKINKEIMKQTSDNDETNDIKPAESGDESPTDDPSTVEGLSEENSENDNQISKKRKADADAESQDDDDTTPKKGRPRKRKK